MKFSDEKSEYDYEEDDLMGCVVPAMMMHQMETQKKLIINALNEPGVHGGSTPGRYHKQDRKSTRLNSSHSGESRMPSSA